MVLMAVLKARRENRPPLEYKKNHTNTDFFMRSPSAIGQKSEIPARNSRHWLSGCCYAGQVGIIKQTEQCFDTQTQRHRLSLCFTQMAVSVSCYCVVNSSLKYSILIGHSGKKLQLYMKIIIFK